MKLSLNAIAQIIEDNTNVCVNVKETWIDYGAKIKGQQIVINGVDGERVQILTPRELKEIELGLYTIEQVQSHIDKINEMYA